MGLPDIDTALSWVGRTVVDRDGEKIGTFDEIYLDAETDRPEWAAVKSGLLGALVPLSETNPDGDDLRAPFEKAHVDAAPSVDADSELSQEEEAALYEHYGVGHSREGSNSVLPDEEGGAARGGGVERAPQVAGGGAQPSAETQGTGLGGETDDEAEAGAASGPEGSDAMIVSEQEVPLGTEARPRERLRIKRYVVTEHVQKTVPLRREELRLEPEPPEGGERASAPPESV